MRHRLRGRKLNRSGAHRKALGRNLVRALVTHHRIITTQAKAKNYRSMMEKLITLAKANLTEERPERKLHNFRRALSEVPDRAVISKLFNEIAPKCAERQGGYTRILRLGKNRLGDNGPRVIWELVDLEKTQPVAAEEE